MRKNILETMGSVFGLESPIPGLYEDSNVAYESYILDAIEDQTVALESLEEVTYGLAFMEQEVACESLGIAMDNLGACQESIGTEAIKNMIKRGAYSAAIAIKNALKKIVQLFFTVIDMMFVSDGKWKGYSKLFKKYREKLLKAQDRSKESNKEITIRSWSKLPENFEKFCKKINDIDLSNLKTKISGVTEVKGENGLKTVAESIREALAGQDKFLAEITAEVGSDDYKEKCKEAAEKIVEAIKEADENYRETKELSFDKAKTELLDIALKLEKDTKKDIKYKKDFAKLRKDLLKKVDQLVIKSKETEFSVDDNNNNKISAAEISTSVGNVADACNSAKLVIGRYTKHYISEFQGVLADMAKVANAGTSMTERN